MVTLRFHVKFDATNTTKPVSIHAIPPTTRPYRAPEGITLITFTLVDTNNSGAAFPTHPIQWVVNHEPAVLPIWFAMHRFDARNFSLWDFNSDPERTCYNFVVSVFHNGQIISTPDPTIINDPPASPPEE